MSNRVLNLLNKAVAFTYTIFLMNHNHLEGSDCSYFICHREN